MPPDRTPTERRHPCYFPEFRPIERAVLFRFRSGTSVVSPVCTLRRTVRHTYGATVVMDIAYTSPDHEDERGGVTFDWKDSIDPARRFAGRAPAEPKSIRLRVSQFD
ncbi:hypothetical protein Dda_3741 [Drechslerella dactyloides]|uniref:Uncharacterized protein n=1 Tax=Drechslerella dactyloides TaxID=74499 RepID=A0AAD6J2U6_DREDA|nr:hypothetical protein Dda_3741 [Drechslerella dactyloides]